MQELKDWVLGHPNFEQLYKSWIASGHNTLKKPSIDRLNDYKPYTFDNIRLTTWEENKAKLYEDKISGRNNKTGRPVLQFSKDGQFIKEHYSCKQAQRDTGAHNGHIIKVCNGVRKTAGGFVWRYKKLNKK